MVLTRVQRASCLLTAVVLPTALPQWQLPVHLQRLRRDVEHAAVAQRCPRPGGRLGRGARRGHSAEVRQGVLSTPTLSASLARPNRKSLPLFRHRHQPLQPARARAYALHRPPRRVRIRLCVVHGRRWPVVRHERDQLFSHGRGAGGLRRGWLGRGGWGVPTASSGPWSDSS